MKPDKNQIFKKARKENVIRYLKEKLDHDLDRLEGCISDKSGCILRGCQETFSILTSKNAAMRTVIDWVEVDDIMDTKQGE